MRHTPGPWAVRDINTVWSSIDVVRKADLDQLNPNKICSFHAPEKEPIPKSNSDIIHGTHPGFKRPPEAEKQFQINHANAALISTAPELLEILEEFMEALDVGDLLNDATRLGLDTTIIEARTVLAKARGET